MSDICAQGAAQGVWNEITRRVVGGSDVMHVVKAAESVISVMEVISSPCEGEE